MKVVLLTRLVKEQLVGIPEKIDRYDVELRRVTGFSLREIACQAAGIDRITTEGLKVGVIPVTAGKGVIAGFSEAVTSVLSYLGFDTLITASSDVSGFREALLCSCQVLFIADDHNFIASHLPSGQVIDNYLATATGYVTALEAAAGGLRGKRIGLLGLGRIGLVAARLMVAKGADIRAYDPDPQKLRLRFSYRMTLCSSKEQALENCDYIFEASPAPANIEARWVKPGMVIAAPGIPLGLSADALQLVDRLIHDPLQLGVATMATLLLRRLA